MEFKHFVVTRFNIDFRHWKTDKAGKEVRTRYWLKSRLILFNQYCLPSVVGQTNKNFEWLVLVEEGTDLRNFPEGPTYLFVNRLNWLFVLKNYIVSKTKTKFIITTRLDNDDALHRKAINDIQTCFDHQDSEFLNLRKGYILHGKKVYKTEHRSNQFLSLIERLKNLKTVYLDTHGSARKHGTVKQLTDRRYWIRVVHGRNMIHDNLAVTKYVGKIALQGFNL